MVGEQHLSWGTRSRHCRHPQVPLSDTLHERDGQLLLLALAALRQPWLPQEPLSRPQTGVEVEDCLDLSLDDLHLGVDIVGLGPLLKPQLHTTLITR